MTTIMPSAQDAPGGRMQDRVTGNVRTLLGYYDRSKKQLAEAIGVDPAGVTARLKGETRWRTDDIEAAAGLFGVPFLWLVMPLTELLENVERRSRLAGPPDAPEDPDGARRGGEEKGAVTGRYGVKGRVTWGASGPSRMVTSRVTRPAARAA